MPENVWIVASVTLLAVIICVTIHYEALRVVSDFLPTPKHHHRRRVILLILCLLFVHIVEIWVFGVAYFTLLQFEGIGQLVGMDPVSIFNCVYYSAVVFSTLGFGDIVPIGSIRFLTGMEAIAGLTFITWSASYTYVEISKRWDHDT